ncbi:MAG: hypothetical protein HDT48_04435 [Ruminococcaceae bacterium]|nr:hypothetical protein [Oscillospiraceae bacterium]
MASIRTAIELDDRFSGVLNNIINTVNMTVAVVEKMNSKLGEPVGVENFNAIRDSVAKTTVQVQNMNAAIEKAKQPIQNNTRNQQHFNDEIQSGVNGAGSLTKMLKKAVGAYAGIAGIKKTLGFVEDCFQTYNTQLNAENQLIGVLKNNIENAFSEYEISVTADTSAAVSKIGEMQSNIESVEIPAYVKTAAVNAAFDKISKKASEIQGRGIYGDEVMIAAAAEFSTYFTDTNAIEMMMDTLADYVMGMEGGVTAVDSSAMVNYATNLGKIMTGAYDAMTKKGFKFTDAQKAIIEGTATQEQIVSALGQEYLDMNNDMRAAAAISQVIEESWGGLYENMSNTSAGAVMQMQNTWGDLKETVGDRLAPAIKNIADTINENWGTVERIIDAFAVALDDIADKLPGILNGVTDIADFIIDNWSLIAPIIFGVTGAVIALQIAQSLLNTAMYACPVTWIIVGIFAILTVFLLLWDNCEGFRKFITDMWASQTKALGQFYNSVIVPVANGVISIQHKIVEAIKNTCIGAVNLFADMAKGVIESVDWIVDGLRGMIDVYNSIVSVWGGKQINADLLLSSEGIDALRDETVSNLNSVFDGMKYTPFKKLNLTVFDDAVDNTADYLSNSTVSDIINSLFSDMFGTEENPLGAATGLINENMLKMLEEIYGTIEFPLDNIDDNTANIADSLSATDEELKYLRDIADKEAVNRFTTAEITIEQTNNNNISSDTDLDGIVNGITDAVTEAVFVVTEGVHV